MSRVDFAVIGAGASGALVTVHLARTAPARSIALVGRGRAGQGIAYATADPEHILNVPAAGMSAFPDAPDHFVAWLRDRGLPFAAHDYVPRSHFGTYLHDLLSASCTPLRIVSQATGISRSPRGLLVEVEGREQLEAATVILATGMLVPPIQPALRGIARRAWDPDALEQLTSEDDVLLLGTGLTMVDVVLTLCRRRHRGTLHALSRHGLLPTSHAPAPLVAPLSAVPPRRLPGRLCEVVRLIRLATCQEAAHGGDWRAVIDALRPATAEIWTGFDLADRRRFLRHLRVYWDIHRHRMAPEAGHALSRLRQSGQLRVHAGRIESVRRENGAVHVGWRERATGRRTSTRVSHVIDCATAAGLPEGESPLIQAAQAEGLVCLDPLGLGIETASLGQAIGSDGVSSRLFAVGALRRFERWESTAVPELRIQAATLARHLAERAGDRCAAI
ncbi:MAG TPA: FAD/NAD(P)-binding protein [Anaeromyxobacteraceae bacterium]|nr:FAD/NAD(P)-binding protein [Anaeromyxobacteraceae bacterium]